MTLLLRQPQILQIHAAALEARLAESREALLAGISPRFRSSLVASPTPGGQILSDLDALNHAGKLADGSVPLRVWLTNAQGLAHQRVEAEVFRRALDSLGPETGEASRRPENDEPLSVPPPSAAQATWNNVPARRIFVGREADLAALDRALSGVQRRVSIHGLAGVGKTALALAYAQRALISRSYPGGVYWLGAEGEPQQAFVRLANQLLVAGPPLMRSAIQEALSRDRSAAGLTQALKLVLHNHPEPSLLVLDNVDSDGWKDLAPEGEVRLVSTARDERWAIGEPHRLEALAPDEASELSTLIAGEPRDEHERATQRWVIGTELGGHAVAVEMASRAVKRFRLSWAEYKRDWRERAAALSANTSLHGDYPRGVFEAIDLSLDRRGVASRRLVEGAAVFAPEEVPYEWAAEAGGLDPTHWDTKDALATLEGLGLVNVGRDGKALSIHRLVHLRVRERADKEEWIQFSSRGAVCVAQWLERTVDPTRMARIDARRPHLDEALAAAERAGRTGEWIDIANRLATHLQYRALYHEAHALFARATEKAEAAEPPDPARIATSLSNLALVLQDLGRPEEARPLLDRSLSIVEKIYGSNSPKVATRLSNLAAALLATGEAEEALALSRRAAEILEKNYGSEHPRMAAPLSSLAAALHGIGEAEEALPISKRSLAIAEQTYGAEHPRVAPHLSTLAMVLNDLGQAEEARALLERAHAIAEKTYGPEHPKVAATLSNLAEVMLALKQIERARILLERAVTIDEKAYGTEHPKVAQRRSLLASAVRSLEQAPREPQSAAMPGGDDTSLGKRTNAHLVLRIAEGEHVIDLGPVNSFGRSPSNSISLDDPLVSREHCIIELRSDHWVLRDLGGRNGTFVNSERVQGEALLKHGDEIAVGAAKGRFHDGCPGRGVGVFPPADIVAQPDEFPAEASNQASVWTLPTHGGGFRLIGSVADKALAMGRAEEAERILQALLLDILTRAREGHPIAPPLAEMAAKYAARLGGATKKGMWVDYVFELYKRMKTPLPAQIVDELYTVVRKAKSIDLQLLRAYLADLRGMSATLGPVERFLIQRIEGLERLASQK